MANTHVLLASNTLGTASSSVTFSSIPSTFTDLKLVVSARATSSSSTYYQLRLLFNNTGAVYSSTATYGYSSLSGSSRASGASYAQEQGRGSITSAALTADTFSNTEIYIPNYASSVNKPLSGIGFSETNDTSNNSIVSLAHLYQDTAAISTITASISSTTFVAGSSFNLYGIKNS